MSHPSPAAVFSADPNTNAPFEEALEWRTDLLTARDGTESALQLRSRPRRTLRYPFYLDGGGIQRLDATLFGAQGTPDWLIPLWTDQATLASAVSIGASTLTLSGYTGLAFTNGGMVMLWRAADDFEVLDVNTVSGATVNLAQNTTKAWAADTLVTPVVFGIVGQSLNLDRITSQIFGGTAELFIDPVRDKPNLPTASAPVTYNGYELYPTEPNWAEAIPTNWIGFVDSLDPGIGGWAQVARRNYSEQVRSYSWLFDTRSAIQDFRAFLQRRLGSFVPVYLPTWDADLTLTQTINPSDTTARFINNAMTSFIGVHPARTHCIFQMSDGSYLARQMSSPVANSDGTVTVTIAAPGITIAPAAVDLVSYLPLWRMADAVIIKWHSAAVAEVAINFRAVKP